MSFIPGAGAAQQSAQPKEKTSFGGFGSQTFEEPTTGEKIPAVCVERVFDLLPGFKPTDKPQMRLILVFELEETREDGTRFFRELNLFPGFTKSGKSGCDKHFKTWAGSATPLNEEQQAQWTGAVNGTSNFETGDIDPNPPIVGANCQLILEHNEKGTFINIAKVYPPSKEQMEKPLTVSEGYKSYWTRKREREERNSQQGSGGRGQSRRTEKEGEEEIPFN